MGVRKTKATENSARTLVRLAAENAKSCLGASLAGVYLFGSLALGDFDPESSDIDLLVVTEGRLKEGELDCLQKAHEKLFAGSDSLAKEVEVTYLAREALNDFSPGKSLGYRVDRGSPKLRADALQADWFVNFFAIRQGGEAIAGPPFSSLLPEITLTHLKQAIRDLMEIWWFPISEDPEKLVSCGYRYYTVLTMARMLATFDLGKIVTKREAGRWAEKNLEPRWVKLVQNALDRDPSLSMEDTREFIRWTALRLKSA